MKCTELPTPRRLHGAAVIGNRLFVLGGETPEGWSNEVLTAEIEADGTLGASWAAERPLPQMLSGIMNNVEVVNDRMYVVGGLIAADKKTPADKLTAKQDTFWTRVQPDGKLAPWQTGLPFGQARIDAMSCASDTHLFIVGGNAGGKVLDSIFVANFALDGSPENWHFSAKMPIPLWKHGATIHEGRMYVWGGLQSADPKSVSARVFSSPVDKSGSLGAWQEETSLPSGVYGAAFGRSNNNLVCVRGEGADGKPAPAILWSRLEGGKAGEWKSKIFNVEAERFHAIGHDTNRGAVFVTGGALSRGGGPAAQLLNAVQAFRIGSGKESDAPPAPPADSSSIAQAAAQGKMALIYFRSSQVPGVKRFEDAVINTPEFTRLKDTYAFSIVETTDDPRLSYQFSVFRVPAMVIVQPDGKNFRRSKLLENLDDVKSFLSGS